MFDVAGTEGEMRDELWEEAFQTAVDWWNVTIKCKRTMCLHQSWLHGEMPKWTRELKTFGEIGVVKKHGILCEVEKKGFDGMMVGHAKENAVGAHRMLNSKTKKIHDERHQVAG